MTIRRLALPANRYQGAGDAAVTGKGKDRRKDPAPGIPQKSGQGVRKLIEKQLTGVLQDQKPKKGVDVE